MAKYRIRYTTDGIERSGGGDVWCYVGDAVPVDDSTLLVILGVEVEDEPSGEAGRARVLAALKAAVSAGEPVTVAGIARDAHVGRVFIQRRPDLRDMIREHEAGPLPDEDKRAAIVGLRLYAGEGGRVTFRLSQREAGELDGRAGDPAEYVRALLDEHGIEDAAGLSRSAAEHGKSRSGLVRDILTGALEDGRDSKQQATGRQRGKGGK